MRARIFGWVAHRQALAAAAALLATTAGAGAQQFSPNYQMTSTVPANGDLNPYGVWIVPPEFHAAGGIIAPGDILVSNFNNKNNMAGTGTTIVLVKPGQVAATGSAQLFWQGTTAGLDTGLVTLQRGFVLVSSLPTSNGTYATHGPGVIMVLNNAGNTLVSTISGGTNKINGPWDMAVVDNGATAWLFVSNIGTKTNGFVTRLKLSVSSTTVTVVNSTTIAEHYTVVPSAFAGPTGLVYDPPTGILYVAAGGDEAIYAVGGALTRTTAVNKGTLVFHDATKLHDPVGMAAAPDGGLIIAQADGLNANAATPSEYVEITKSGKFVSQFNSDPNVGGAFGLAIGATANFPRAPQIAVVDDNTATLSIFTASVPNADISK